ncbi:MAG: hypothetical protein R3C10_24490 [Pirellulales bacterium]
MIHSPKDIDNPQEHAVHDWVPQFGLRALLGMVALTSAVFAIATALGQVWGWYLPGLWCWPQRT